MTLVAVSTACSCSPLWKRKHPGKKPAHAPYCATRLEVDARAPAGRVVEVFTSIDAALRIFTAVRKRSLETLARAHNDSDGGHRPNSLGGGGRGGSGIHDHAVGERVTLALVGRNGEALAATDIVAVRAQEFVRSVNVALRAAETALAAANYLAALDPEQARLLAEQIVGTVGACCNCGCLVPGTRDDRLRAGRCFDCYRYRLDHDGTERPKNLWDACTHTSTTTKGQVIRDVRP